MSNAALQLEHVSKSFPYFVLDDLSLTLPQGQIMGFIGANGAGKSTTMRLLMGFLQADKGSIQVLGHAMPKEQVAAKWNVGYFSDDMRLYEGVSLQWYMDYYRSIFPRWDGTYASKLLQQFGLIAEQKIKGLSRGQQVKAGLLLVLARRPKLLLLDEPTTGLDPVARREILDEIFEVLNDEERSVLFSSHNTQDVEQISDLIAFIDRGKLIDCENKETYLQNWRRIRMQFDNQVHGESNEFPNTIEFKQSGHLAVAVTNQYQDTMLGLYQQQGATIQAVETMTLEEIFVAKVFSRREKISNEYTHD